MFRDIPAHLLKPGDKFLLLNQVCEVIKTYVEFSAVEITYKNKTFPSGAATRVAASQLVTLPPG